MSSSEDFQRRIEQLERENEQLRAREEQLRAREEQLRARADQQNLSGYLASIHRVTFHMHRLVPPPRTSTVPTTLSEGEPSKPTTSGRTSIVGKFYPQYLRHWTGFDSTCRATFARVQATLGSSSSFPSVLSVEDLSRSVVEDLPREFLGSEAFINEMKTSQFLHETLQKPAQRILNAYLQATGQAKTLYFDNRSAGWRPLGSSATGGAALPEATTAAATDAAAAPARPPKPQPDCLILCANMLADPADIHAAVEAERDIDTGDDAINEPGDNVQHIHRISIAEHKAVHRLRAAAVARFANGAIDQNFVVQLARIAREGATTPVAQEEAARDAKRGPPGQVFFVRALTQAFHYMVSSGIEYGYMATGETLSFLHVPRHDPRTLLYHTTLFPQYTQPWRGEQAEADIDVAELPVSQLTALCLLAFESHPEPLRQRCINVARLVPFPKPFDAAASSVSSSRESSPGQGHRKRPNDDNDNDDTEDDEAGASRSRSAALPHAPRQPSPLKRQRSAAADDAGDGDGYRQKRHRVSVRYNNIVKPTLPSPLDPSTFRPIRPYCSQVCLYNLVHGSELDPNCPNVILHQQALQRDGTDLRSRPTMHPLTVDELHELVRLQLLANVEQDCHCFLDQGLRGAIGCLFKITVTGYGYTFVAKGVESYFSGRLRHELCIYNGLTEYQGTAIPVCLGLVELQLPWPMSNGTLVTHMLLLSYAGRPLYRLSARLVQGLDLGREERRTLGELTRAGLVDDDDISNGNLTWSKETQRVMKIDFDHARLCPQLKTAKTAKTTTTTMAEIAKAVTVKATPPHAVCWDDNRALECGRRRRGRPSFEQRRLVVESLLLA